MFHHLHLFAVDGATLSPPSKHPVELRAQSNYVFTNVVSIDSLTRWGRTMWIGRQKTFEWHIQL